MAHTGFKSLCDQAMPAQRAWGFGLALADERAGQGWKSSIHWQSAKYGEGVCNI